MTRRVDGDAPADRHPGARPVGNGESGIAGPATPPEARDSRFPIPDTIGHLVADLATLLAAAGVDHSPTEARDLVAALLDEPRFWPSLHRDAPLEPGLRERAVAAAARRSRGEPFAYAVGRAAFRHLTLEVDGRVLIPRQETEGLVDCVLGAGLPGGGIAVDVATGSGAIALALASEGRFARVLASDVSLDALAVAGRNVERCAADLRAPVELLRGSYLAPVAARLGGEIARTIVSNPPYIAYSEIGALPASVRDWEPPLALLTGGDGLDAYRALARDAAPLLEPNGLLALEVDSRRASLVAELLAADGRYGAIAVRLDLAGRERVVLARRLS